MSKQATTRRRLSPRARNGFLAGFVVAILLQLQGGLLAAALGVALMVALVWTLDRRALGHMGNWRFWLVAFVVTGLSGWLLGKPDAQLGGIQVSVEGLRLGLAIMLRAIVFMFGLSVLSRQIETRSMVRFFGRLGMPQLGGSVALAIELLPTMQERWGNTVRPEGRNALFSKMVQVLADTHGLVERIAEGKGTKPRVVLLTASRNGGKTACLSELRQRAEEQGVAVGGFLQPKLLAEDTKEILGYDLLRIHRAAQRVDLSRRKREEQGWDLSEEAFTLAASWLEEVQDERLILIDELGKAEAEGAGHWPALTKALALSQANLWVLALRKDRASGFVQRLSTYQPTLLDLDDPVTGNPCESILSLLDETHPAETE